MCVYISGCSCNCCYCCCCCCRYCCCCCFLSLFYSCSLIFSKTKTAFRRCAVAQHVKKIPAFFQALVFSHSSFSLRDEFQEFQTIVRPCALKKNKFLKSGVCVCVYSYIYFTETRCSPTMTPHTLGASCMAEFAVLGMCERRQDLL